jgi:hypothetical protein
MNEYEDFGMTTHIQPEPERSGRNRSKDKSEAERLAEDKARGHRKMEEEELTPEFEPPHAKDPKITEQNRGHQKGYGKNQREEGLARHTQYGTRAPGGERH